MKGFLFLLSACLLPVSSVFAAGRLYVNLQDFTNSASLRTALSRPGYVTELVPAGEKTLSRQLTGIMRPGDYALDISIDRGNWDNGEFCYEGGCRCVVAVKITDHQDKQIATLGENWVSLDECRDGAAKVIAELGRIPRRTDGRSTYDLARTLEFAQCRWGDVDPKKVMAGLADPSIDINYECKEAEGWHGIADNSAVIFRLLEPSSFPIGASEAIEALASRKDLDWSMHWLAPRSELVLPEAISMHLRGVRLTDSTIQALIRAAPSAVFDQELPDVMVADRHRSVTGVKHRSISAIAWSAAALAESKAKNSIAIDAILARADIPLGIWSQSLAKLLLDLSADKQWAALKARPDFVADAALIWHVIQPQNTPRLRDLIGRKSVDVNTPSAKSDAVCQGPALLTTRTMLGWAAWYGDFELARAILARPGVDIDATNACGDTALAIAKRLGRQDIVTAIKEYHR